MKSMGMLWGVVFGFLAALCYGTSAFWAKVLYGAGFASSAVLIYRFGVPVLTLGAILAVRRTPMRPSRRDLATASSMGLLFCLCAIGLFSAFARMDVGVSSTIMFAYPAVTALLTAFCFKKRIGLVPTLAIALAIGGIGLLSIGGTGVRVVPAGVMLSLLAAFSYGSYLAVSECRPMSLSPLASTFWVILFCELGLVASGFLLSGTDAFRLPATAAQWTCALGVGTIPSLLALYFISLAVPRSGSTVTAVLGAFEPLATVVIGVAFFGETFTWLKGVGIACVVVAVVAMLVSAALQASSAAVSGTDKQKQIMKGVGSC